MNYYNPYFSTFPYTPSLGTISNTSASKGLLSSLLGGGKISSFINGTQKTLNIINQAIPLLKQVSPVVKNAKTMFKVMNEFKRVDKTTTTQENITNTTNDNTNSFVNEVPENGENILLNNDSKPTFFL